MKQLIFHILFLLAAASCHAQAEQPVTGIKAATATGSNDLAARHSKLVEQQKTTLAFTAVIREYLLFFYKDEAVPGTLFIGRHSDFPDITLPGSISGTPIKMMDPVHPTGEEKRTDFVFLNVVGNLTPEGADFIVITFKEGFAPQHNSTIQLNYRSEISEFVLADFSVDYPYEGVKAP